MFASHYGRKLRESKSRGRTLKDFIQTFTYEIDGHIRQQVPNCGPITWEERRLWVLNDEYLYRWARSEGVKI